MLFGILTLAWPAITLLALVFLFGAYLRGKRQAASRRRLLILQGVIGVGAGILTFVWPSITALALLYLIAGWAIFTGGLEIASAIRLRKQIDNEWLLGMAGALSLVFGAILVLMPGAGALAITWLIGVYAVVFGMLILALAFKLRRLFQPMTGTSGPLSA